MRNCLSSRRTLLLYQFTRRMIKLAVITIVGCHCYQLHTKLYQISFCKGQVLTYMKLLGIIFVDFNVTDQLLIIFLH
jgi:lactam utilization protein B